MKKIRILLLLALFLLQSEGNLYAQSKGSVAASLENNSLQVGWMQDRATPISWDIQIEGNKEQKESYSFLGGTRNKNLFKHLDISGILNNQLVVANSCAIAQGDSGKVISTCFLGQDSLGLKQVFELGPDPYRFKYSVVLSNPTSKSFTAKAGDNLTFSLGPGFGQYGEEQLPRSMYYFVEPIASIDGNINKHVAPDTLRSSPLWKEANLEWAGLHNRYFALLMMPAQGTTLPFSQVDLNYGSFSGQGASAHDLPEMALRVAVPDLAAGATTRWDFTIFSGPKSYSVLKSETKSLTGMLFSDLWSWMRWLCLGLYHLLVAIYTLIPNWGWAIIALALVVRIVLYPFGKRAQKSQDRFIEAQKLMRPEMVSIKEKYKGGEQSERILQLYKKYDVSPFAGLKPLLVVMIQLPVLIALFHVLGDAFELRNAGFLWIETLAEPDRLFPFGMNIPLLGEHFNLLPFLMAIVTLLTFKLSPAPTVDKKEEGSQNFFLLAMTVIFFFLFYAFPAGMVLYWTFANVFQIAQQKLMRRGANNV